MSNPVEFAMMLTRVEHTEKVRKAEKGGGVWRGS